MHSGQFSPDREPVLVMSIPDYISVRKLILATDKDKEDKKVKQEKRQAEHEKEKAGKETKKIKVMDKLEDLGFTVDEIDIIMERN